MTRAEFLEQLRSALQGNVQEHVVQENVAYYKDTKAKVATFYVK